MKRFWFPFLVSVLVLSGCCADMKHDPLMPHRIENSLIGALHRGGRHEFMWQLDKFIEEGTVDSSVKKKFEEKKFITEDYIRAVIEGGK